MNTSLLKPLIPAGVVGVVVASIWGAQSSGLIPAAVAYWLWPSLVAAILLGLGIFALVRGAYVALWPLGAGFLVQCFGIIMMLTEQWESGWRPFWHTLGAVGFVLLIILLIWGLSSLRRHFLEKGLTGGGEGDEEKLDLIRKEMSEALELLRRAGRGRNAIYELPWFLVMGRPAGGKTVAIKNSGLGLPVKKDWVKGVGGSFTSNFFFTNDLIFLDTPGKWVENGLDEDAESLWTLQIDLLKKYRGRRPLDGLIVVVPSEDLLTKDDSRLREQACNIREVVDLFHEKLHFRFPIYILVSKCDLVEGFVEFFGELPVQRRHEIFGWSNAEPDRKDTRRLFTGGFRSILQRMEGLRTEMLSKVARRSTARRIFFFTEEFSGLERPLSIFVQSFFQEGVGDPPLFRGLYFTSGTQEGAPLSRALAEMARTLGVTAPASSETIEEGEKRSYFLKELFRELMVEDEGLVGRTAVHWWRQRRNTMLGAFMPAGIAVFFLLMSGLSLFLNRANYHAAEREVPQIVENLNEIQPDLFTTAALAADAEDEAGAGMRRGRLDGRKVLEVMEETGRLRTLHKDLTEFDLFHSFGMRRPGGLAGTVGRQYSASFQGLVLEPTLATAQAMAIDEARSCLERIDIFQSVIWLRMGGRFEWSDETARLDSIWGLPGEDAEEAAQGRKDLIQQYRYFQGLGQPAEALLPGFSIHKVASSIHRDCQDEASSTTLGMYREFQDQCRQTSGPDEIEECYERLNAVFRREGEDMQLFTAHFTGLRENLGDLTEEQDAGRALTLLDEIELPEPGSEGNECFSIFLGDTLPAIREYSEKPELIDACKVEVGKASTAGAKAQARNTYLSERLQQDGFVAEQDSLAQIMADFNTSRGCRSALPDREGIKFRGLDFEILKAVVWSHWRVACSGYVRQPEPLVLPAPAAPAPVVRTAKPAAPKPKPVVKRAATKGPRKVSRQYHRASWSYNYGEWLAKWGSIETGFFGDEKEREKKKIENEVRSYAGRYVGAWRGFLDRWELPAQGDTPAERLTAVADADLAASLKPAMDAITLEEDLSEAPFTSMATRLKDLEGLGGFVDSGLGDYQENLRSVAEDLAKCTDDPSFFSAYLAGYRAADRSNSLVAARRWVEDEAGPGLLGGVFKDGLMKPLDDVTEWLEGGTYLQATWAGLRRFYADNIQENAPFMPWAEGVDSVPADVLQDFLGQESGQVVQVRRASEGQEALPPAVEAWLQDAEELAELFFKADSNDFKQILLGMEFSEPVLEPKGFRKSHKVEKVKVIAGEGASSVWEEDAARIPPLKLELFPPEEPYSFVEVCIQEKSGLPLLKKFKTDCKPKLALPLNGEEEELTGFWAPVRMLRQAMADAGQGSSFQVQFRITKALKKKEETIDVSIDVTSSELRKLLDLLENGFPAPPEFEEGG